MFSMDQNLKRKDNNRTQSEELGLSEKGVLRLLVGGLLL